jgi:hypothetical protein
LARVNLRFKSVGDVLAQEQDEDSLVVVRPHPFFAKGDFLTYGFKFDVLIGSLVTLVWFPPFDSLLFRSQR